MVKLTRLKDVRQRKALTQQQLAEKAGVNRVTIARIEGGKDEPLPTTLRKVADALGVDPEELLEPVAQSGPNGPARAPINATVAERPLDERITVVNKDDVHHVLEAEPDLLLLVNEAADHLLAIVPDARLRLESRVDPEYGEPEQLFLEGWTELEVEAALEALNRFDREWGIPNARRGRGLLIVDLR
jgi:HTH-type transcriptional regulator, competence development regulator